MDKSECAVPSWEGDSLCDDVNNNEGCNWDGGDCCPPHGHTYWSLFCEVSFRNTAYSSSAFVIIGTQHNSTASLEANLIQCSDAISK